ncbi:MAG: hypothetical protein AAFV95_21715 [Bacteroidota bacterium]
MNDLFLYVSSEGVANDGEFMSFLYNRLTIALSIFFMLYFIAGADSSAQKRDRRERRGARVTAEESGTKSRVKPNL